MSSTTASPSDPAVRAVARADVLRTVVSTARSLVTESRIELDSDGLHLAATDPATVASLRLSLAPGAFDHYDAGATTIGVDLERLADVLSLADGDDLVAISVDDSRGLLHVECADLHYTLALVDPDAIRSPPDPEKLQFDHAGGVRLDASDLTRVVRAAEMVSDHVDLELGDSNPVFRGTADGDTDTATVTRDADDLHDATPGDASATFSVSYLDDVVRVLPAAPVDLSLGEELPLELDYEIAEGHGTVEFLLSPRIRRN